MPLTASLARLARVAVVLATLLGAASAQALCIGLCSCAVSTTPLLFTGYNPLSSSNSDSTGNVRVSCGGIASLAVGYTVALSAGTSGSMTARTMASGANRVAYNLYTSVTYGTIWGDGSGSSATVGGTVLLDVLGLAPPLDLTIYGRIPGGQSTVAPGAYGDSLVVTVTYN